MEAPIQGRWVRFDAGLRGPRQIARLAPRRATLNGKCAEVCPVQIPLPALLRGWRIEAGAKAWSQVLRERALRAGPSLRRRPSLYRLAAAISVKWMRLFRKGGWIKSMPSCRGMDRIS